MSTAGLARRRASASRSTGLRRWSGFIASAAWARGAHYFHTPPASGEVDRNRLTPVGRALDQLGVEPAGVQTQA
ncbi:MAG TPA: hypothetical protein VMI72_16825 [Roseiarcus sp.]|nr:hypothetical protein [Roseiarcus sp.]